MTGRQRLWRRILSEMGKRDSSPIRRQLLLAERASSLGLDWAKRWRETLQAEGRRAAGAWPGTLSEARARVDQLIAVEQVEQAAKNVTDSERNEIARAMYAAAKRHWNEHRDREED